MYRRWLEVDTAIVRPKYEAGKAYSAVPDYCDSVIDRRWYGQGKGKVRRRSFGTDRQCATVMPIFIGIK